MGSLERRAQRLEEQTEWRETCARLETERVFKEALLRASTAELQAMRDHFRSTGRDEWAEEDKPLMLRLLQLMEEVRREEAEEFPWLSEINERSE